MTGMVVKVNNSAGLHARPASLFVKTASQFESSIRVSKDGKEADAKGLLAIMTLGVKKGDQIKITAEGIDEKEALQALKALFESNFAE